MNFISQVASYLTDGANWTGSNGIPALFLGLGLIVSVLQAFVFALLTMVYINLALQEAH